MVVSDGTRLNHRVVHTSSGGGEVDGSPLIIRALYRFDGSARASRRSF